MRGAMLPYVVLYGCVPGGAKPRLDRFLRSYPVRARMLGPSREEGGGSISQRRPYVSVNLGRRCQVSWTYKPKFWKRKVAPCFARMKPKAAFPDWASATVEKKAS